MDDRYRIRPGTSADLSEISGLERVIFSDPWSDPLLEGALAEESFVAVGTGGVVAYLFLRRVADEGEILNLAVAPEHRRRGVARRLLEVACRSLHERGVQRAFLEVRESNDAAKGFYQHEGFRPIGRRSRYYRNPPEAALVLVRDLGPLRGTA